MEEQALDIIRTDSLTKEDQRVLDQAVDRIIDQHKQNQADINKLTFEAVAALTEAEEAERKLSNKSGFQRLLGGITGSNQKLQNKINASHTAAQYAAQLTLQKLAEQNLLTFDLITVINNKLNASLIAIDEEFRSIYAGLSKFMQYHRKEMTLLSARMDAIEQNVQLLNWESTIAYQEQDGRAYQELGEMEKIVCVVRDFYALTKGAWTNQELLLLKPVLSSLHISPKKRVNYFETLKTISKTHELEAILLDDYHPLPLPEPERMMTLGILERMDSFQTKDRQVVENIRKLAQNRSDSDEDIRDALVTNYVRENTGTDVHVDVEIYDLLLDFLYNIRQGHAEHLLSLTVDGKKKINELVRRGRKFAESGSVRDQEKAYEIFSDLAADGLPVGLAYLGACYQRGIHVTKNDARGLSLIEEAVRYDEPQGITNLGVSYLHGWGVKKNIAKAMELFQDAALMDNADAVCYLADGYAQGIGLEMDAEKAMELYQQAAALGSVEAMVQISCCYHAGKGTEKNPQKAVEWIQKARAEGYAAADTYLGLYYCEGFGVSRNLEQGVAFFQKAAACGDALGLYELGKAYAEGFGVAQDIGKAAEAFRGAAERGNVNAMERLGDIHTINAATAADGAHWYRKAVKAAPENGSVTYKLAVAYDRGIGVYRDQNRAIELYQKAADLGDGNALCVLGDLYCSQQLYPEDTSDPIYEAVDGYVEHTDIAALKCYRKAAEHGCDAAVGKLNALKHELMEDVKRMRKRAFIASAQKRKESYLEANSIVELLKSI